MTTFSATLPIKTSNPLNGSHRNWRGPAALRKKQRAQVAAWFASTEAHELGFADLAACVIIARGAFAAGAGSGPAGPLRSIRFTRIAPSNGLDDDSLPASLKSVRDEVCAQLGVDDGPRGGVSFAYGQERGARGMYAVRVEVEVSG